MKRLLLTLVCCSPLLFCPLTSFSIDLVGPNGEQATSYERYGPITSVETLWKIASKLRPNRSVSVQQTLVAIYKLNPNAFKQGNINRLITDAMINVPTLDFIKAQTNSEAMVLIGKYSIKKANQQKSSTTATSKKILVKKQVTTPKKIDKKENVQSTKISAEPSAPSPLEIADKKVSIKLENKLANLQKELDDVNELLIVETDKNRALKIKFQPLNDQIEMLEEKIEDELLIQSRLQNIIDDYQRQLDSVQPLPFAGEGQVNKILRLITASLTNLLIAFLSPILLMLAVFVVVIRLKTKYLLAEQEQELAESTAGLMEESGQFDSLLTEDISDNIEIDFADEDDDALIENVVLPVQEDQTQDDDESNNSNVPEEDLISHVNLDEIDIKNEENDPFGIGALTEDEKTNSITEPEQSDAASSGVSVDTTPDDSVNDAESSDLDLASQWESQLDEEIESTGKQIDDVEKDVIDLTISSTEEIESLEPEPEPEPEPVAADVLVEDKESDSQSVGGIEEVLKDETGENNSVDLLAEQLSDVAFNAEIPLPKVDKNQDNDFIDIETLLGDSEKEAAFDEPDLDLELDEFPDVVGSEMSVDIDDENEVSAQLDLARAYLEIDDKSGAKKILESVVDKSEGAERVEIDKLLSRL